VLRHIILINEGNLVNDGCKKSRMPKKIHIRPEKPEDIASIDELTKLAPFVPCRDNPASGTLCGVNARKIVF
jgi:hypothetical protein